MFRHHSLTIGLLAALIHGVSLAESGDAQSLLIQQGHFWQAEDKPLRAGEVWSKLLLLDAQQPDALYGLGVIELKAKRTSQAEQYLDRLKAIQPLPRQALQLEQDIFLATPSNQQRLEEARLLVDSGEREKAVAAYRQLLAGRVPQGLIGREYYNNLGYTDGNWKEARAGLERLVRERPDDAYVALFLAKHLARRPDTRGEGIKALAVLAKREDIGGDADESWRLALIWMGPPSKTQASLFETFLKSHPDDTEIRALLAKGRAQPQGAPAWQRDPGMARGLKALEAGDRVTAEREFSARLKVQPNDADALGGLGVLRQQQNRLEDAEVLLIRATRQKGGKQWRGALNDVRYWSLLQHARDNQTKGDLRQARSQLEQAVRLKPKDHNAQAALADLQAQAGQYAEAEAGYRRLLAQQPDNPQARRGLIAVLTQSGQSAEALQLIEALPKAQQSQIGDLGRMRAEQAMQQAKLAEQRGDRVGMRQALEEALRHDPSNAWGRFALARVYVSMGAVEEARSLVDGLLVSQPDQPDALYTSALLSVQLGEWQKAQAALARIPAAARTADVNRLVRDVDFNLQLQQVQELSAKGRHQDARVFLRRIEALTDGQPERLSSVASAYADAGDPQRGLVIMRDLLARSPRVELGLTLRYAGILLKADQDVEASTLLRNLQGENLTAEQRQRYDDLLFLYRVRQAEQLRERGDLASAYDTLAPALAERPQSSLAGSALARMYAASGDPAKALELYKPLVRREPDNAPLLIGAADMAAQMHENDYANDALERALSLTPGDPLILSTAARIYRFQGKSKKAAELLKKVVAEEQRQGSEPFIASTPGSTASSNPFAAHGSHATAVAPAAVIPPPVQALPSSESGASLVPAFARGGVSPESIPGAVRQPESFGLASSVMATAPGAYALPAPAASAPVPTSAPLYARAPLPGGSVAGNPFAAEQIDADPRAHMSPAARALDDILQERSGFAVQGLNIRSNDSESGLSKLTAVEAPFEANIPLGDNRLAVRVTPISLSAGSIGDQAASRFGGGPVASMANPGASPGSQKDSGVGLALAFENPAEGLKADLGTTPQGFLYSTLVGGVSLDRGVPSTENLRWGVNLSRRPVTDSLLSFAGAEDQRTGQQWGGVTANGARGELSFDDGEVGAYAYGALHQLLGNHVESNNRGELGAGAYWYLQNDDQRQLTAGVNLTGMTYDKNLGHYTYGHGGYFSPQRFLAIGLPVSWSQRFDKFTYLLKGSVGMQYIDQDDADYFPGDAGLQAAATSALGREAVYQGDSKTGIGYSLYGNAEYQMAPSFFLGGHLGLDNAQDYRQWSSGLYLRYMFEDISQPMALPVSPYRSPYLK